VRKNFASYNFSKDGNPISNLKDEEYREQVELAKSIATEGMSFNCIVQKIFTRI